jgi:hypothetical protein
VYSPSRQLAPEKRRRQLKEDTRSIPRFRIGRDSPSMTHLGESRQSHLQQLTAATSLKVGNEPNSATVAFDINALRPCFLHHRSVHFSDLTR